MININNFFSKNTDENKDYLVSFANPIRRFFSFIIDTLLIQILILICLFGYFFLQKQDLNNIKNTDKEITLNFNNISNTITKTDNKNKEKIEEKHLLISNFIRTNKTFIFIVILFPIFYNIAFLFMKQQSTIGQKILGLKVVKNNNEKLKINQIINRVMLFSMSQMPIFALFFILLPLIFTKGKFTLYDIVTKTYVIEIK